MLQLIYVSIAQARRKQSHIPVCCPLQKTAQSLNDHVLQFHYIFLGTIASSLDIMFLVVRKEQMGGGFRIGNSCTPVADSCQCMAKPIQYCKVK